MVSAEVAAFVKELRAVATATRDDSEVIARVRPLVSRLALDRSWIEPRFWECDEEQGFGVHLLHEEPDHTLAVFVAAWLPGRGAPPHNHGTWAVIAGVDGSETNVFWKRLDDGTRPGYAEIVERSRQVFGPGEVVSFLPDSIHSVVNEGGRATLSLHVYGKHLNYSTRWQFDPDARREMPIVLRIS